jgi:hypothetical protein
MLRSQRPGTTINFFQQPSFPFTGDGLPLSRHRVERLFEL